MWFSNFFLKGFEQELSLQEWCAKRWFGAKRWSSDSMITVSHDLMRRLIVGNRVTVLMMEATIVAKELQNLGQIACISTTIPLFLSLIFVVGYHRSQVCVYEFSWIYIEIEAPAERSRINRCQKPQSCKIFHKGGALNTHLLLRMLHAPLRPGKPSEYINICSKSLGSFSCIYSMPIGTFAEPGLPFGHLVGPRNFLQIYMMHSVWNKK